jgi:hypothetical protein
LFSRLKMVTRDIKYTSRLTIDLVLRRIICLNRDLDIFSSIDFDGENFLTFGANKSNGYYIILFSKYWVIIIIGLILMKNLYSNQNFNNITK